MAEGGYGGSRHFHNKRYYGHKGRGRGGRSQWGGRQTYNDEDSFAGNHGSDTREPSGYRRHVNPKAMGLRGKEIGLFYAARSKEKKQMLEKQSRQTVSMNEQQEEDLNNLLSAIRSSDEKSLSHRAPHRGGRGGSAKRSHVTEGEGSRMEYKSRGEAKHKHQQERRKHHVSMSDEQKNTIKILVRPSTASASASNVDPALDQDPQEEAEMSVASDELTMEQSSDVPDVDLLSLDFIPLVSDENAGEEEELSDFMMEFYRHRHENKMSSEYAAMEYVKMQPDEAMNERLKCELMEKHHASGYLRMLGFRKNLPAFAERENIIQTVRENQVVVISGGTGCGKTTQVAQFILDDHIERGDGSVCKVVCTQPRRISAISVAERVAEERGEPCGQGNSVGYQIRMEQEMPRNRGSILYCTTGIVLRWLITNRSLSGVSHIILDEIHERDLQSDFLMIVLKDLIVKRKDLKVILMSATLNAEMFSEYFANCPMLHIPGFTFPVEEYMLEDILQTIQYRPPSGGNSSWKPRRYGAKYREEQQKQMQFESWVNQLPNKYSSSTLHTLKTMNFNQTDVDLTVAVIDYICRTKGDGAILVFMAGWDDIKKTREKLLQNPVFNSSRFKIYPLHSMLPSREQREIFKRPPPGVRKIVIATNIAETSITIDDVVYVVNAGKSKIKDFDPELNISILQPTWITIASARQRRGRAGRVQPGECYHLYTRYHEEQMKDYDLPEILRTQLDRICLDIKMLKLGKVVPFVMKAMQPPRLEALTAAVNSLKDLNALDHNEDLTPLGYHLAKMPLDPNTGKMLLMGAMFSCLDPILTVAASLNYKDAFYKPMEKDDRWAQTRRALANGCKSDHILMANAYKEWEKAEARGRGREFCNRNFLTHSTLLVLQKYRQQFVDILIELGFARSTDPLSPSVNRNSGNEKVVCAVLCAGLYPKVAKIHPDTAPPGSRKPLKLSTKLEKRVNISASSINELERELPSLWLVYHLIMKTAKVYLYDCTAVSPYALLFFGDKISTRQENGQNCVVVDDWISFKCSPSTANLVKELRLELDKVLEQKITNPGLTSWDPSTKEGAVMQAILDLIITEEAHNRVSHRVDYRNQPGPSYHSSPQSNDSDFKI